MYGTIVTGLPMSGYPGCVVQLSRSAGHGSWGLMAHSSNASVHGSCVQNFWGTHEARRRMDRWVRCSADTNPWSLMGRVVREDRLSWNETIQSGMILAAAVKESDLIEADFYEQLQKLMVLLPELGDRVFRMKPKLLAFLVDDTASVALKLVQLRQWFPSANVSNLVMKRPMLLLDDEFAAIPAAVIRLREVFPNADICSMVETQPLMLVEDLDEILAQLKRLLPTADVVALLERDPGMLSSVMDVRGLSLW